MDNKKCKLQRKRARKSTSETRVKIALAIFLGPQYSDYNRLKIRSICDWVFDFVEPLSIFLELCTQISNFRKFVNFLLEKLLFSNKIIKKCISSTQVIYLWEK